jgi:hypothetical protein
MHVVERAKQGKYKLLRRAGKLLKLLASFRVFSSWRSVPLRLMLVAHKEIIESS